MTATGLHLTPGGRARGRRSRRARDSQRKRQGREARVKIGTSGHRKIAVIADIARHPTPSSQKRARWGPVIADISKPGVNRKGRPNLPRSAASRDRLPKSPKLKSKTIPLMNTNDADRKLPAWQSRQESARAGYGCAGSAAANQCSTAGRQQSRFDSCSTRL